MRTVHRYAYGAHLAPPPLGPSCPAPQVGTARRRQARVARNYSARAVGRACEHRWGYRRAGSPAGVVGLRLSCTARGQGWLGLRICVRECLGGSVFGLQ